MVDGLVEVEFMCMQYWALVVLCGVEVLKV